MSLNFLQEKKEADFRYGLVRVRENAESIAFYGGEDSEMQLLLQRFKSAFENLTVRYFFFMFTFFSPFKTILYNILPLSMFSPIYFFSEFLSHIFFTLKLLGFEQLA